MDHLALGIVEQIDRALDDAGRERGARREDLLELRADSLQPELADVVRREALERLAPAVEEHAEEGLVGDGLGRVEGRGLGEALGVRRVVDEREDGPRSG